MTVQEHVRRRFEAAAANRFLGLRLVSAGDGAAEVAMPMDDSRLQENGVAHGGLITALADTAAAYSLLPDLPEGRTMAATELNVSFLRPALPDRGELTARARTVKRGQQIAVSEVVVVQGGREVARARVSFLFSPSDSRA